MRKGKCTSVCRTGKLSTISREEENKEIVMEVRKGSVIENSRVKRLALQNLAHWK